MAKYRSASLHVLGSEKAAPADVPPLPGLTDPAPPRESDEECREAIASAQVLAQQDPAGQETTGPEADDGGAGPADHALSRPRTRRGVAPAWLAGGAAALALLGLVAWGSHDAFGARKGQTFPCPPATTTAVQAATGCEVPPPPAIDGEIEE